MQGTGATTAAVSRLAAELQKQEVLVKAEFLEQKRIPDSPTAHKEFAVKRLNSRSYQMSPAALQARCKGERSAVARVKMNKFKMHQTSSDRFQIFRR